MLGRAGHRVAAFERFAEIYRLPRAVHLDHEIMRLLQSLGLSEVLADEMVPVDDYRWFGADGELLLHFEPRSPAPSGWEADYMFFQPELERAIDDHACTPAGVTVERGWAAEGLVQSDERVELTLRRVTEDEPGRLALTGDTRTVTAAGWSAPTEPTRSCAKRAGSRAGTSAFRSGGLSWTPNRTTWRPSPTCRSQANTATRYARPPSCRAAPGTGGGSSCSYPTSRRPISKIRRGVGLLDPCYLPEDGRLTRSAVYEFARC